MGLSNLEIVSDWYATRDTALLAEDVDWRIAEGFPAAGQYRGRRAVAEQWWPRHIAYFSEWEAKAEYLLDAGQAVIAVGAYRGRVLATGSEFKAPFAHIWWLSGGRVMAFDQFANSLPLHRAITERKLGLVETLAA